MVAWGRDVGYAFSFLTAAVRRGRGPAPVSGTCLSMGRVFFYLKAPQERSFLPVAGISPSGIMKAHAQTHWMFLREWRNAA